jgi:DNA-binding response OmpR family regulator
MPPVRHLRSILVVEDDQHTRDLLTLAFKAAGFHAIGVGDGADALRLFDVAIPTLLVLDLGLPRVSGHDVARELSAHVHTRQVPIVVLTGQDDAKVPAAACVLRKPVAAEAVVAAAEQCLACRSATSPVVSAR